MIFQIALELIPGLGNRGIKQLISYSGSAYEVFKSPKKKLLKIPGIGEKLASTIISSKRIHEAESILTQAAAIGSKILHYTDPDYPERLKQLPDAPNIIHYKGNGALNPKRCISVVGTRKATEYGKQITDKLISDLKTLNVTVVSGLAYGIDIQAHRTCIETRTPTFAVLAGGLDRIYPSAHKKYAEAMMETGGLLSESVPGTKPDKHLFPSRNRIIAGLADATIVIEAAEKGGALITANIADSYNRLVFAVPGEIGKTYSEGTNHLISTQKALIYTQVEDLVYHLNWDIEDETPMPPPPELENEELKIYTILRDAETPLEIDLIALKSNITINMVASTLLSLEFKNLVRSLPGKKYGLA